MLILLLLLFPSAVSAEPAVLFQQGTVGTHSVPVLLRTTTHTATHHPTVLFTARLENNNRTTSILYLQPLTDPPTTPVPIVQSGDSIPSTHNLNQQTFTAFTDLGGSTQQVLFLGEGNGTWGQQNKYLGLYSMHPNNGTVYKIVDTNDRLPTGERFKLLCCGRTVPHQPNNVIFGGASAYDGEGVEGIYVWNSQTQTIATLVDNTRYQLLRHISGPTKVTELGDFFFFATNPSIPLADGLYHLNMFAQNNQTVPAPMVLRGSALPRHKNDSFLRVFTAFGNPLAFVSSAAGETTDSMLLFTASGSFGALGVYVINATQALRPQGSSALFGRGEKIKIVADNLDGVHHFGGFPNSPTVDDRGNIVFNADTNDKRTTGLYYVNECGNGKGSAPVQIRNVATPMAINIDIQFNSVSNGVVAFYTNNGTVDQLWYAVLNE